MSWMVIVSLCFGIVLLIGAGVAVMGVVKWFGRKARQAVSAIQTLDAVMDAVETQSNQTPRQLQNLTRTYSELIRMDFPEFDVEEFLSAARNTMVMILNALEKGALTDASKLSLNLKHQVETTLEDICSKGEQWFFDDILVHKACIAKYSSGAGTKIIRIEIALQYRHGVLKDGRLISGSKDLQQYKYVMDAVYIQDVTRLGDLSMKGHHCPSCGAPVRQLGEGKFCEYCGTGLTEINVRIWTFDHYSRC